jgi:hypothetical protein
MSNKSSSQNRFDIIIVILRKVNPFSLPIGRGDDAYGLAVIRGFLISSLFVIAFIALIKGKQHFLQILGLSLTVALASLLVGGLLGFLFGIPRSKQAQNISPGASPQAKYADNTNLEDISDWLTKIIVGVSLIQFNTIQKYFDTICNNLSAAYKPGLDSKLAYAYSGALIAFFLLAGFLAVYLWARTYLMETLSKRDKIEMQQKIKSQEQKIEMQNLEILKKEFQKTIQRIDVFENKPEFVTTIQKAKPKEPKICEDCQKGRWGGKVSDVDYTINATVTKTTPLDMRSVVNIKISQTTAGPKTIGRALFILHDSFLPEMIREILPAQGNNIVEIEFPAYEAFTVGIVIENADASVSVYEVDLNQLENLPDGFKYSDTLLTIDQVNDQLLALQ